MGPKDIKDDIYNVMTNSRELTNYCQESITSIHSKKISNSLNNFHLKTSIDFLKKSLTDDDQIFKFNDVGFENPLESDEKQSYTKVIDYIESFLS